MDLMKSYKTTYFYCFLSSFVKVPIFSYATSVGVPRPTPTWDENGVDVELDRTASSETLRPRGERAFVTRRRIGRSG